MADDELIYLDNNATTQLDPVVIEEMLPFFAKYYGNPSAGYLFAAQARKAVDLARDRLARLLECEPTEIVFTSGGTESNNAVINSALRFEGRRYISWSGSTWQRRSWRIGGRDSSRNDTRFDDVGK